MQNWVENFAKDLVEYPVFAMSANANSIANVQCERTLREWMCCAEVLILGSETMATGRIRNRRYVLEMRIMER